MSRYVRLLTVAIVVLFLTCGVTAAADTTTAGMKAPDYSGDFRLIPDTENFKSPDPSFYVWETGGILGSIIGYLSNMLMMGGVAILKLSILVMDLGMHPSWLNSTIDAISEAAQSKGWSFVDSLWPFIVLGAFFMVGKDYWQGSYAVMLRRLMVFALSLTLLSAAFGMSSSTVSKSLTATIDFSDWLSTKFMDVFSGQGSNGKDSNIYTAVWEQMANRPLEAGEFGELNIKISPEDAEKINKAIGPYQVVAGMKWVDALLWFAPDTDERSDMIDIYADNYETKYESAKNPYSRLMISVISLLSSVLSALFLLMIGAIMIVLVMYFIGLIMSGIIILPASLVPTKEPVLVMKYLTRILGVFMSIAFIFLYTALVLIIANLFTAMESLEFLFRQLLVMIAFVGGLVMFFVLLGKLQSAPGLKHMNDVMKPVSNAAQYAKRRYGRRRNANRISDYIDDELEDGFDDLGSDSGRKAKARASKRSDRTEAKPEIKLEMTEDGNATLTVIEQPKTNTDRTTKSKNKESLDRTAPPAKAKGDVAATTKPAQDPEGESNVEKAPVRQDETVENVTEEVAAQQKNSAIERRDSNAEEQRPEQVSDKKDPASAKEEVQAADREAAVSSEENSLQAASNQVRAAQQQNNQSDPNVNDHRNDRRQPTDQIKSNQNDSNKTIEPLPLRSKEEEKPTVNNKSDTSLQTDTMKSDSNPAGITKKDIDQMIRHTATNDGLLRDRSDIADQHIGDNLKIQGEGIANELSATNGLGRTSADRTKVDGQDQVGTKEQNVIVPKNDVVPQTEDKTSPSETNATIADLNRLKEATADKDQNMLKMIEDTERHVSEKIQETNETMNKEIKGKNRNLQEVLSNWQETQSENTSKGSDTTIVPKEEKNIEKRDVKENEISKPSDNRKSETDSSTSTSANSKTKSKGTSSTRSSSDMSNGWGE